MEKKKKPSNLNFFRSAFFWIVIFMGIMALVNTFSFKFNFKELNYSEFYRLIDNNLQDKTIKWVKKTGSEIGGEFTEKGIK